MTADLKTDIVIVGGGMVGATLALALLEQTGYHVTVIERAAIALSEEQQQPAYTPSFDARSTALANGSCRYFNALGVWSQMREHAAAIKTIHVSDQGHFGKVRMHAEDEHVEAYGFVVENHWIGSALLYALQGRDRLQWLAPAELQSHRYHNDHLELTVEHDGQRHRLQSRLLVIADGAYSQTRQQFGIGFDETDYGQTAIVSNVALEVAHDHIAYERFTRLGPLALLPMTERRFAIVWSLAPEKAGELLAYSDDEFMAFLQMHCVGLKGDFVRVGKRVSYPLKLVLANEQIRPRCVVLGNAAHSLHPVAGQGFNLSVRDIQSLVSALQTIAVENDEPGQLHRLQTYAMQRERDQQKIVQFSDKLVKLFTMKSNTVALGRTLGMLGLDLFPDVKAEFAFQAMGRRS